MFYKTPDRQWNDDRESDNTIKSLEFTSKQQIIYVI